MAHATVRTRPPQHQNRRAATRAAQARRRRNLLLAGGASVLVVVVIAVLVVVKLASGGSSKTTASARDSTGSASAAVLQTLAGISPSSMVQAAAAAKITKPQPVSPPVAAAGEKPEVLYIGADYCPFCAAQRWAVVTALSQFGTWTNLGTTSSSASDAYPNTATFSFHGATFTSPYLTFTGVETATNQPASTGYQALDKTTPAQDQLMATYDKAGSIPFLLLGGRYVQVGAAFMPDILAGMSVDEIAKEAANPATAIGKSVQASAAAMITDLCQATNAQPASVCSAFSG